MAKTQFDKLISIIAIIVILSMIVGPIIFYYSTSFEKDIIVKEKYISQVYNKYGSTPIYYVVGSDDTTYQIVDMWWKFKFNNMDDYAKINIGKTYRVKGYGKRIPFLGAVYKIYDIGM